MKMALNLLLAIISLLLAGCKQETKAGASRAREFRLPVKVTMNGYDGNIMEPFLSRDGTMLLFNNLNSLPENTNLHWATRINDSAFFYKGEIAGVNTPDLEGVPTLDSHGNLYFVSTRNYTSTLSTLYQSGFLNGTATGVKLIEGISKLQAGSVNFDVEVSADGQSLYFVDAQVDQSGHPATADLIIAKKENAGFQRMSDTSTILKYINTDALEYAACISADELELYFTRVQIPFNASSSPEIFVATRKAIGDAFGIPLKIREITGFAEAPTISPDQKLLYYHKKENNKFVLYMISKR